MCSSDLGCILAEDGCWCAMMIIVNHPLHLDWLVWMMVMLVLLFEHHRKSVWMVLLYGCILAEDGGWCAMMIIVNHQLRLDWLVWMMVMWVLEFGEGMVMEATRLG